MGYTAEEQRRRASKKRETSTEDLIQCLECDLKFRRIGSHVVQVHGYSSALEYRRKYGLMKRETIAQDHQEEMRDKARNSENLVLGAHRRFYKGGDHGKKITEFWKRRNKLKGNKNGNV